MNQLKQIGLASLNRHDQLGALPPGWNGKSPDYGDEVFGPSGWGWAAHTLNYMEETALADRIVIDWPMLHASHDMPRSQVISSLVCPSDIGPDRVKLHVDGQQIYDMPKASYVGNFGIGRTEDCGELSTTGKQCDGREFRGVFYHNSDTRLADMRNGTSHTIMVGERTTPHDAESARASWTGVGAGLEQPFALILGSTSYPINHQDSESFSSRHPGGALFVYADGHVEFISENIDPLAFASLGSSDKVTDRLQDLLDEIAAEDAAAEQADGEVVDDPSQDDDGDNEDEDGPEGGQKKTAVGICPICGKLTLKPIPHEPGKERHRKDIP